MEYNGLTFEYFKQCLNDIEDVMILNDRVADLVSQYGKTHGGEYCDFGFPTNASNVITLLSLILGDTNDWIGYWCFERNFGRLQSTGTVTGEDGTVYPLETAEHLWNLLAAERRERDNA